MASHRVDALLRTLNSAASRRGILAALSGLLAAGPFGPLAEVANARRAGKRQRRRQARRKKRNQRRTPSQDAVTTLDAACAPSSAEPQAFDRRFAQTFLALRSGRLTSASVVLAANPGGNDFALEIWAVGQDGVPVKSILASTTISGVPATSEDTPRPITGAFSAPAQVTAGQRYALVITETTELGFNILANDNNTCPDGDLFEDGEANEDFVLEANADLIFTTFVTA
jgi:hypothetical protein